MAQVIIFVLGILVGVYLGNKRVREVTNKTAKDTAVYLSKTLGKKKTVKPEQVQTEKKNIIKLD